MSEADREVLANLIWVKLRVELDDRGCLNGIDEETLDEIDISMVINIESTLKKWDGGDFS